MLPRGGSIHQCPGGEHPGTLVGPGGWGPGAALQHGEGGHVAHPPIYSNLGPGVGSLGPLVCFLGGRKFFL